MASATFSSKGEINQKHARRFAAISYVTYGPHGIIAEHASERTLRARSHSWSSPQEALSGALFISIT
jgi:hypothetical protein